VKRIVFLLVPCLVLTLVACTQAAKPSPTPAVTTTVTNATIQNIRHENLNVKVGATITWTNQDGVPHTVTAEGGKFKSSFLNKAQTFSFTFREAGSFNYFCEVHPNDMRATVAVTP
jgi:plastocyanin